MLNTLLPVKMSGLRPMGEFPNAPQRPKLELNGFSPSFPVVVGGGMGTPGVDPMSMSMNRVPTAWTGCFERDERSGITKKGKTPISGVMNPMVDTFHSKVMNDAYQSRGRFMGQKPGMDIKVKLTC
tara:strand:- start:972 stop:1349 length:378 start_codon:yes stop_codon:yes gene_type:complete